jgi:hypothetical protein
VAKRKRNQAPGDNTAPATTGHYVIVPAPPVEQEPSAAGHAAPGGERPAASIAHYEECPYCMHALPHNLTQHTAAIMRQPGARPQR